MKCGRQRVHPKSSAFILRNLHLRKKETVAAKFVVFLTFGWTAAVDSPIPEREDDHVR